MAPLLRAMLWLKDIDRIAQAEATVGTAAGACALATNPRTAALNWRHEQIRRSDRELEDAVESVYSAVEQLAGIVDKLKV
jgi:hypothetical protein